MVGSGGLAAMGVWCLLFGGEGEKKRASGWPFRNEEARRLKEEARDAREGRRKRAGVGMGMEMEMEMEEMGGKRGV